MKFRSNKRTAKRLARLLFTVKLGGCKRHVHIIFLSILSTLYNSNKWIDAIPLPRPGILATARSPSNRTWISSLLASWRLPFDFDSKLCWHYSEDIISKLAKLSSQIKITNLLFGGRDHRLESGVIISSGKNTITLPECARAIIRRISQL